MISVMVNGVLIIDKPSGMTSHDVVQTIRKVVHERKVGHAGTLDPFATGLLVIGIGRATRLLDYVHDLPKTYEATFVLGATSDTDDVDGVITKSGSGNKPTQKDVETALQKFLGTIDQIPPAYAAIKIQGKKMYDLARAGEHVVPKARNVTIHTIELLQYTYPEITVRISCGSGTYIRAIGRDLGAALTTGAYTKTLRRTSIGSFSENQAIGLTDVSVENFITHIQKPAVLIEHLPKVTITPEEKQDFEQGKALEGIAIEAAGPHAVFCNSDFVGIGSRNDTGALKPDKVLSS